MDKKIDGLMSEKGLRHCNARCKLQLAQMNTTKQDLKVLLIYGTRMWGKPARIRLRVYYLVNWTLEDMISRVSNIVKLLL